MQYSLLSRFQGALLGTIVGEWMGLSAQSPSLRQAQRSKATLDPPPLHDSHIVLAGASSLAERGSLQPADWCDRLPQPQTTGPNGSSNLPLCSSPVTRFNSFAGIPIGLFFHDWFLQEQEHKLYSIFFRFWQFHTCAETERVEMWALAWSLARLFKPNPEFSTWLPDLVASLHRLDGTATPLMQQLQGIQALLEKNATLEQVSEQVSLDAISLGLFGFLSLPYDYPLGLQRLTRLVPTHAAAVTACTIVSTLAGAYNGRTAIPISWRQAIEQYGQPDIASPDRSTSVASAQGLESQALHVSQHLLATWSGCAPGQPIRPLDLLPTAAPGIIRPR